MKISQVTQPPLAAVGVSQTEDRGRPIILLHQIRVGHGVHTIHVSPDAVTALVDALLNVGMK